MELLLIIVTDVCVGVPYVFSQRLAAYGSYGVLCAEAFVCIQYTELFYYPQQSYYFTWICIRYSSHKLL